MKWFTLCGYDGNYNIVIHVQAPSLVEVYEVASARFSSGSAEYTFEGKLQPLDSEFEEEIEEIVWSKE